MIYSPTSHPSIHISKEMEVLTCHSLC